MRFARTLLGPRVAGLRNTVLRRESLSALMASRSLEEAAAQIRNTIYQLPDRLTRDELGEYRRRAWDAVLSRMASLYGFARGVARDAFMSVVTPIEYDSVRILVEGLLTGTDTRRLVPIEGLEKLGIKYMSSLVSASSLDELRDKLASIGHRSLAAIRDAERFGIDKLSILIDREMITDLVARAKSKEVKRAAEMFAEVMNLELIWRAHMWGFPRNLVESLGVVKKELVKASMEGNVARAVELMARKRHLRYVAAYVGEVQTAERVSRGFNEYRVQIFRDIADHVFHMYKYGSPASLYAYLMYLIAEGRYVVEKIASFLA